MKSPNYNLIRKRVLYVLSRILVEQIFSAPSNKKAKASSLSRIISMIALITKKKIMRRGQLLSSAFCNILQTHRFSSSIKIGKSGKYASN
jgi:hypothetical protein